MDVSTEHIEIVQGAGGPKPVIRGTRIRVKDVVNWYEWQGWTLTNILDQFPHLTPADIHAALAYYWDHKDELDEAWAAQEALDQEYMRQNPSPLREKLKQRQTID